MNLDYCTLIQKLSVASGQSIIFQNKSKEGHFDVNPFLPDCKTTFSRIFLHFSMIFLNFWDLNMIAMPNSHLVLNKETLKQHL